MAALLVGCGGGAARGTPATNDGSGEGDNAAQAPGCRAPVTAFAASSLTESLGAVAAAWEARGCGPVTLSFDASSRLARQIEAGAPADLYVAADTEWVAWLAARVPVAERFDLLSNTLVVVVPAGGGAAPARPSELAALPRIALAGESVPAGKYARAALDSTGVWEGVRAGVVYGANVRAALAWVAAGEADAAVVYRTDARVEPRVREAFAFPADTHPPIVYGAAVLGGRPAGAAFAAWCRGPEASAIFTAAGFAAAGAVDAGAVGAGAASAGAADVAAVDVGPVDVTAGGAGAAPVANAPGAGLP